MNRTIITSLTYDVPIVKGRTMHLVCVGDSKRVKETAIQAALLYHLPEYVHDEKRRTRISVVTEQRQEIDDIVFEYKELFDNSYWRIVNLTSEVPAVESHRPMYEGARRDFVDVEWEFVICRFSNPLLQQKILKWSADKRQQLILYLGYADEEKNAVYTGKLRNRLNGSVCIITDGKSEQQNDDLTEMAKYLHYFYQKSYENGCLPTELPEAAVEEEWSKIKDEGYKASSISNVVTIPIKMRILGHDRDDWSTFYALTADEIEQLTAVEHNRWCVERLIGGWRPCNATEQKEVTEDIHRRVSDAEYAKENPISLKNRYKRERRAHLDLVAYMELDIDETGLPVTRYDMELTAAIPLIVKAYNDKRNG